MSGVLQEIIGLIIFAVIAVFIYRDAKPKVSYSHLVLFGIVLLAFFSFFTIYEWKFVGF
jgi:uncharacterized protein (DUF486 family)